MATIPNQQQQIEIFSAGRWVPVSGSIALSEFVNREPRMIRLSALIDLLTRMLREVGDCAVSMDVSLLPVSEMNQIANEVEHAPIHG